MTFTGQQIHKIPGTNYSGSSSSRNGSLSNDDYGGSASFKAKMESLQDPTNTNLYMEGLPLDTNHAVSPFNFTRYGFGVNLSSKDLLELVAPYKIVSNRFFYTKLSDPPRIIAFVRYVCIFSFKTADSMMLI